MKKFYLLLLLFFLTLSNTVVGQTIENEKTKLLTVVFNSIKLNYLLENRYVRSDYKLKDIEVINEKSYDPEKHKLVIVITKLKVRKRKAIIYCSDYNQRQTKSLNMIFHATKKGDKWIFDIDDKRNAITVY